MTCRNCGTEIAEKALICYRCGAPTSAPVRPSPKPPAPSPLRSILAAVVLVLLLGAALFLGFAGQYPVPPAVSYAVAAVAAVILLLRIWRRRRR